MPDEPLPIQGTWTPPTPPTPGGAAAAAPTVGDAPAGVEATGQSSAGNALVGIGAWSNPTPPTPGGAAASKPDVGPAPGAAQVAWTGLSPDQTVGALPAYAMPGTPDYSGPMYVWGLEGMAWNNALEVPRVADVGGRGSWERVIAGAPNIRFLIVWDGDISEWSAQLWYDNSYFAGWGSTANGNAATPDLVTAWENVKETYVPGSLLITPTLYNIESPLAIVPAATIAPQPPVGGGGSGGGESP